MCRTTEPGGQNSYIWPNTHSLGCAYSMTFCWQVVILCDVEGKSVGVGVVDGCVASLTFMQETMEFLSHYRPKIYITLKSYCVHVSVHTLHLRCVTLHCIHFATCLLNVPFGLFCVV